MASYVQTSNCYNHSGRYIFIPIRQMGKLILNSWKTPALNHKKNKNRAWDLAYFRCTCTEIMQRIEENDRVGKTRDLFKKTGDTKRIFHTKMGMIKDRNLKDLTEAEEIKKRWQENTELYKTQQWPQDWKRSLSVPIPKKSNAKECSNYYTIVLI